jgi:predicted RNA binding protein YcfA (HicA-like mRNA interferase family)
MERRSRLIIKRLKKEGWILHRINGSHHIFIKDGERNIVSVPHPKRDIPHRTLKSIHSQAGWPPPK